MRISRVSPALAMLLLAVSAVVASGSDHAPVVTDRLKTTAAMSALPSDFNGDGVEDRVIGVPSDKTDRLYSSGGFHVLYSPGHDGTMPSSQYFTTQSPSMQKLLKMYPTGFGSTIASGDFDRDGYADVAVSVHGYDEPDEAKQRINVGGIVVIYGTDHGLDVNAAQPARVWSQDSAGVQGVSEDDDAFGSSLVVGDFDGDQFLDLAIGIEGEQVGAKARQEGAVTVLYGGRAGLTARDQIVDQDTRGILDVAETGDWAGHAMAAADFNADGVDDLALGVFSEGVDGKPNAGAVNVIYGTKNVGLTGRGDRFVSQALDSIPGDADKNDWFGATLTVGDFNGDSSDDLVVGAPDDTVGGAEDSGSATYIPGSTSGLVLARSTFLALGQVSSGGGGAHFAAALAAGDVNGDGYDELAVSSPWFDRVDVFPGSPDGPTATGVRTLTPDQLDEPALDPGWGSFGVALQFAHLDTQPGADLLVGMAHANVTVDGTKIQSGAVAEISSRSGVLDSSAHRLYYQGAAAVPGTAVKWEEFGAALPGSGLYIR
jgi:hypothetical protein